MEITFVNDYLRCLDSLYSLMKTNLLLYNDGIIRDYDFYKITHSYLRAVETILEIIHPST